MEIPQNILRELEERKARAILGDAPSDANTRIHANELPIPSEQSSVTESSILDLPAPTEKVGGQIGTVSPATIEAKPLYRGLASEEKPAEAAQIAEPQGPTLGIQKGRTLESGKSEPGFKISFSFPKFFGKKKPHYAHPTLKATEWQGKATRGESVLASAAPTTSGVGAPTWTPTVPSGQGVGVGAPATSDVAQQKTNFNIPIGPIGPMRPIGLIESFPHKPTGIELLFEYLSKAAVYLAIFLTPLFFMNSSDTLGLSKQLLLSTLALISVVGWVGNVISAGNISWRKNAVMWTVLLSALSAVFSSFFSGGFWVSFLGDAGRFAFSGISMLSYLIIFSVAFQSFNKKDFTVAMWLWLSSVFISSLFGLAQIFGKFILPFDPYNLRTFNTVGSVFGLSLFALSPLPFIAAFFQSVKDWRIKSVLLIMAITQIAYAVLIDFKIAWISLAISGLALVLINFKNPTEASSPAVAHKEYQKSLVLPLFLVVFAIVFWFVAIPPISGLEIPAPAGPTYGASIDIMAKTLGSQPVFGSGLETFPYVYAKFKDVSLNQSDYWGTNFNDSASAAITWATTSGIFGVVALLSFIALFGIYAFKNIAASNAVNTGFFSQPARAGMLASWIFILASKFFYPTPLPLELAFWVLPALFIVSIFQGQTLKTQEFSRSDLVESSGGDATWRYFFRSGSFGTLGIFFVLMIVLLGALIGSYFSAKRFVAERIFVKAAAVENTAENRDGIINSITSSISSDPYESRYFRILSQVLFQKMNDVVAEIQKRPEADRRATPEESAQLQNLTIRTINSIRRAAALDPKNVGVSVDAAESYRGLVSLVQGAEDLAIQNYERASEMEPINPFIKTQLGQLYLVKSNLFGVGTAAPDTELAAKARGIFEKALELNVNYANARYFLALIQDKAGERQTALENFKLLRATNPKNELIAQIVQNLENGIPALGYPPQPATPPESPSTGAAKGVPPSPK